MRLTLRYMRAADIEAVRAIDKVCFDPAWTSESYAFEIRQSKVSHMVVLEARAEPSPLVPEPARDESWLRRLGGWLRGDVQDMDDGGLILGYGGLWQIESEAHVSTIATHPEQRGRGYGELLLAGMLGKALRLGADYLVLEVRVSNAIAQNLYQKYGFSRVGRKRRYYTSNKEDAWDMRLSLDAGARARYGERYRQLRAAHGFRDAYSEAPRPRW